MSTLVTDIEAQITGAKTAITRQSVGIIREIGDGVARVEGLADVMVNEMLDLGHGVTGLALNLDETEVGVIILGDYTRLEEGGEVRGTGKLLQVPVGKVSFDAQKLYDNAQAALESVIKAKPASCKGRYLKSATISSTMGPGVKLDTVALSKMWS